MKKNLIILSLLLSILCISCEDIILGSDPENTPENNFDILWKEYDLYYPSFILKNINWDSLYSVYRSRVTSQTTEDELWQIISDMIYHFDDIHVYIYNRDHSDIFSSSHSFYDRLGEFSLPLVQSKYLNGRYTIAGGGNFIYGRFTGDSIGYLYIKSFFGDNVWPKDIDRIITELHDVKALIVDIRDNRGGNSDNFTYIVSAFLDRPITYLREIARNGPNHDDLTPPVYISVSPRQNSPHFNKRTIVLTNKRSASASELFAQVFKYLPYSEQIGDSTRGGLGTSHRIFQLPNGWSYHMPTSLSFTVDGQSLEGIGVAPDIYIRNTREEIWDGYDRILEFTLQYLSK